MTDDLAIVPASLASWDDLAAIFGTSGYPAVCQCQRYKITGPWLRDSARPARAAMLREQTRCGEPHARTTSGLVGYLDDSPACWVAVEPRTAYPRLRTSRVVWPGRAEDKDDDSVWAVSCFVVREGYRGRGLTYQLARATVEYARARGARALEAYPIATQAGYQVPWGDLHVGSRQVFEEAGFAEVSHPTPRCVVMRIDFHESSGPVHPG